MPPAGVYVRLQVESAGWTNRSKLPSAGVVGHRGASMVLCATKRRSTRRRAGSPPHQEWHATAGWKPTPPRVARGGGLEAHPTKSGPRRRAGSPPYQEWPAAAGWKPAPPRVARDGGLEAHPTKSGPRRRAGSPPHQEWPAPPAVARTTLRLPAFRTGLLRRRQCPAPPASGVLGRRRRGGFRSGRRGGCCR